jgi:hypothetical protein
MLCIDDNKLVYSGVMMYEENRDVTTVNFLTTKYLNIFEKYKQKRYPHAEFEQSIYFSFKPSSDCIELIFDDTKQDSPCTGWIIQPLMKPCKVSNIMLLHIYLVHVVEIKFFCW